MATLEATSPLAPPGLKLAAHWRVLISIALLAHLTAIIAAPMAMPPSSELQQTVAATFRPYLDLAYLDHGYRFFAPEPGPSSIVRYTLEMPDGTKKPGQQFPDKKSEWPRLFYHRHFMLSEKFAGHLPPPSLPPSASAEARKRWQQAWNAFNGIAKSFAEHLLEVNGAKRITLELVRHELPDVEALERNRPLDDPKSYRVLWSKTFEAETQ